MASPYQDAQSTPLADAYSNLVTQWVGLMEVDDQAMDYGGQRPVGYSSLKASLSWKAMQVCVVGRCFCVIGRASLVVREGGAAVVL